MVQVTVQARDIKGLSPAIDAVNSGETFVLSGKNYVFDSLGPKSAFGSRFVNDIPFALKRGFQIIRVAARHFLCTNEVIYLLHEDSGVAEPILAFEPFQEIARWTHGFLNGTIFFCNPGIGILYWNLRTNHKGLLNEPGVPSAPLAIVVDNGRLAVIDLLALTWSAPSDGFNFLPSIGGAGAQAISERVGGTPIMITSYSRGTLVWTDQGVMRSEFSGGAEVYRHRGINTEYRPVNSFGVVKLDDETTVVLDPRGLFSSRGDPPKPFTPPFNEFLIEELKKNDSLVDNNLRMEWDPFSRRIYISRAFVFAGDLYDQSFVLYTPLGKWGSFDFQHYGFGRGYWLDAEGYLRQFTGQPFMSNQTTDATVYQYDDRRLYPQLSQRQRQTTVLGSTIRLAGLPESQSQVLQNPGYYAFDASAPAADGKNSLDSSIVVGHFRLQSEEQADQLIQITNHIIGSSQSRKVSTSDVDYNIVPDGTSDEDYNALLGLEDFGINPLSFINFSLRSMGSIDGFSVYTEVVPMLALFQQASRIFSGGALGIWIQLEMRTDIPGEFFHLKSLQLNGFPAGRLT